MASSKSANDADDEGNEIIKSKLFTKLTLTHWAKTNRQNEAAEREWKRERESEGEREGRGREIPTNHTSNCLHTAPHTPFVLA